MKDKGNRNGFTVVTVLAAVLGCLLIATLAVFGIKYINERQKEASDISAVAATSEVADTTTEAAKVEKWQEGDISYNGKTYRYNNNLKTYLFMGIDNAGPVVTAKDYASGGQSDAMFLLVIDNENQKLSMVAINRNSMVPIDMYDADGSFLSTQTAQICLQHACGDGKRLSCDRTVEAVSNMFYGIPISGYLAMNRDGITIMNDALGGVTVEVLDDLEGDGITLKKGETVTLTGEASELYLRGRDCDEFDSATRRLERQQQYLINLAAKLSAAASSDDEDEQALAMNAFDAVEDYTVSSINFSSFVEEIAKYSFDESDMYTVPGTTQMGEKWEEYIIDESEFYQLIIDVFYNEVTE
jgi:LCP family protein required for cell wall assembly